MSGASFINCLVVVVVVVKWHFEVVSPQKTRFFILSSIVTCELKNIQETGVLQMRDAANMSETGPLRALSTSSLLANYCRHPHRPAPIWTGVIIPNFCTCFCQSNAFNCSKSIKFAGGLNCYPNTTLARLATIALGLYGNGNNVSVASIANMGIIVGRLLKFNNKRVSVK